MAPDRRFSCTEEGCTKSFGRHTDLTRHRRTHNGQENWEYQCPACKVTMLQKSGLLTHYRAIHTNQRPFKCSDCPILFADPSSLNRHCKGFRHTQLSWPKAEITAINKALEDSIDLQKVRVQRQATRQRLIPIQSQENDTRGAARNDLVSDLAPILPLQEGPWSARNPTLAAIQPLPEAVDNAASSHQYLPGAFGDLAEIPYNLYDTSTFDSKVDSLYPTTPFSLATGSFGDLPLDLTGIETVTPQQLSLDPTPDLSRQTTNSSGPSGMSDDDMQGPSPSAALDLTQYMPAAQSMYSTEPYGTTSDFSMLEDFEEESKFWLMDDLLEYPAII